jgi:ABC-type branched-subunit amino acid transport system substrate-binding protein
MRVSLFHRWLRVAIALAMLALVGGAVGACGSSSSSSSTTTSATGAAATSSAASTSTPSTASAATKSPLLVGLETAVGSPVDSHPYTEPAAQAAIRAVNARGGLNGHPVKLVFCNDQANPTTAEGCARTFVSDHVIACVGCHSLSDNLVQPILAAAHIPMIAEQAVSAQTFNGSNMYLPQGGSIIDYEVAIGYAVHREGGHLGVAYADVPAGQAFEELTAAVVKAAGGGAFTTKVPVPPTTSDYSSLAALATSGGTRQLLMLLDHSQYEPLMKAILASGGGLNNYYSTELTSQNDINGFGPLADHLIVGGSFPPANSPQMAPFVDDMKNYGGPPINDITLENDALPWVALQVLVKITKGMNTIDGSTIMAALNKAKNIDIGPMLPPWTPSAPGPTGFSRLSNPAVWLKAYKNDQPVLLFNHAISLSDALAGNF